ncbi:hypothetical protein [Actibacterium ureilyticum]|uniref:hypothetical protein n=1 Tax=Actibacterium ureilyticum TaxID=1590614 RepID=UPI000BAAC556|nr:hypothetical protein [Actibacterium ureilyticum]
MALGPEQVDCAIAVMLKILDGKCRMPPPEARIMTGVYELLRDRSGARLGADSHRLIDRARADRDMPRRQIYEARVLAETRISRPVMKAFKAALRDARVLPDKTPPAPADRP